MTGGGAYIDPEPSRPEGYELWPDLLGVGHASGPAGPGERPLGFLAAREPALVIAPAPYRQRAERD